MTFATIKYKDWAFEVDRELTRQTYNNVAIGGPESCGCNDGKNFANSREDIYPDEIKKLFDQLGIDYKKESEICHYGRQPDGLHYCGGWFHFKGKFQGKDCTVPTVSGTYTFDLTPINDKFSIGFRYDSSLTFFADKNNIVQIEFLAKTPWTIESELESE
jgi:hypothetical protein